MILKQLSLIAVFTLFVQVSPSHAQIWKKVQDKLEQKADQKIDDVLNGKKSSDEGSQNTTESTNQRLPGLEKVHSFQPGDSLIFASDFEYDTKGRMPKGWKTSNSGSIVSIEDMSGKWIAMSEKSTYKIDSLFDTPDDFTVEFDLITRSSESADIGAMSFGFARDNSVRSQILDAYNDNAITNTSFHFWNREVSNSSSDTEKHSVVEFPFANYSNASLHVAIAVEGENLSVYVNKAKVLDTQMFNSDAPKYFYITSPYSYDQQAQVYFGNFVMAGK